MTEATCRNEDCGHEWTLTKPVSAYSRGVTCPSCGSSRVEYDQPEPRNEPRSPGEPEPQQAQQAPQRAQQSQGQNMPANQQAMETGQSLGQMFAAMNSDDPTQQAEATGGFLKTAGMALAQYGQKHAESKKQAHERAKNTSSDQLRKKDEYPECPEPNCEAQITEIPSGQFPCPRCGTMLTME